MDRAVPSTVRIAASRLPAVMSCILVLAICSSCLRVTLPTCSLPGLCAPEPFTFQLKTPPAAILLKKAAGLHTEKKKGSGAHKPGKEKVGQVTRKQLEQIAKTKMQDMTAGTLEAAMRTVEGTALSMGIDIVG